MIDVTAAIIQKNNSILICQRPEGKNYASLWEFPGGKVEPGESLETCLKRELREELDIEVKNLHPIQVIEKPDAGIRLHFFTCQLDQNSEPKRIEHAALAWIEPEDIEYYTYCPSDGQLIHDLGSSIFKTNL